MSTEVDYDASTDWYIFAGCTVIACVYFLVPSILAHKYRRLPGLRQRGPMLTLLTGLVIFLSTIGIMFRLIVHEPVNCMVDAWWIGVNSALIVSLLVAKAFRIVLLYRVSAAKYRMSRKTTANMAFPQSHFDATQDYAKQMTNQTDGMAISVELKATQHEMHRAKDAQDQRSDLDRQQETKLAQFYYDVIGHRGPFRQATLSVVPRRSSMFSTCTNPEGEDHQWPLDRGRKGALGHVRRVLSSTFSRRHTPRASNDTDSISLITAGNDAFKQHSSSAPSLLLHPKVLNGDAAGIQRMRSMSAAEITQAAHVVSSDAKVMNGTHVEPAIPTALTSLTTVDQATATPSHMRPSMSFLINASDNDWFYRHRHWNRAGCGTIAIVSTLLIQICVLVAMQVSMVSPPYAASEAFITCITIHSWWVLLGTVMVYAGAPLLFFIYQLRSVHDVFHIRTELLFNFIALIAFPIPCLFLMLFPPEDETVVSICSYAILGVLIAINVTLHTIDIIFPLGAALRLDRISAMSVSFEEVMADTMNFEKFKVFCIIDFSVENVLFYERVNKLYQMFEHQRASARPSSSQRNSIHHSQSARNSTTNQDELSPLLKNELMHIYEMYIAPNAEYEVNLEYKTRRAIIDNVKRGNFYLTMYETALQEIVSLMTQDTFPRFLRWSTGHSDSVEDDTFSVYLTNA